MLQQLKVTNKLSYKHHKNGPQERNLKVSLWIFWICRSSSGHFILRWVAVECIPDRSPPAVFEALTPVPSCKVAVCSTAAHWHTILLCSPDAKCSSHHPPCHPSSPHPSIAISLSLFSLYLSFPDHERSCWWSVRLASSRWRGDFKTDKEWAALSLSGGDDPGSKSGNWVNRKSIARDIIMTNCENPSAFGELRKKSW